MLDQSYPSDNLTGWYLLLVFLSWSFLARASCRVPIMSINDMVLRCERTGKLFFSQKEAELHGEETGLSDFAQVSLKFTALAERWRVPTGDVEETRSR